MKVLLVETRFDSPLFFAREEPLALEIVAGSLVNHDVQILDMRLDPDFAGALRRFQPDVVATNGVTAQVYNAKRLLMQAKELLPESRTVIGGQHATLIPEDFDETYIDAVVIGPGEFTLAQLLEHWERGRPLSEVDGIAFRREGSFIRTRPRRVRRLDDAPPPRRDLTRAYRQDYFQELHRPAAMARTSMGCSNRCNFCALWKMAGGRYLVHSPERIVSELKSIKEDFVFFADADTFINPRRANAIVSGIEAEGIRKTYRMFVNADTVVKRPEMMAQFAGIGLEEVIVGYEAIDDAGLRYFNKNTKEDTNQKATRILYDLGINIRAYFLVRMDFTPRDFRNLARYVEEQGLLTPFFTLETPFPGTEMYDRVEDRLTTRNYEHFDLLHPTLPLAMPAEDFVAEYEKLARKSYSLKRYLSSLWTSVQMRLQPHRKTELENRARRLSFPSLVIHAVGTRMFLKQLKRHLQKPDQIPLDLSTRNVCLEAPGRRVGADGLA